MAKGMYIGIDDTARKVNGMYVGVDGVARKVKKGYIGVDGVAQCFFDNSVKYIINIILQNDYSASPSISIYVDNKFYTTLYGYEGSSECFQQLSLSDGQQIKLVGIRATYQGCSNSNALTITSQTRTQLVATVHGNVDITFFGQ